MRPMLGLDIRKISLAILDVILGFQEWRLWHFMAWQEIKQRYRRTVLGPFWQSMNMAVQMAIIGLLLGYLFGMNFGKFLPYVCGGFLVWGLYRNIIFEGTTALLNSKGLILQIKRPLSVYIFQIIWMNFIVFLHNIVVFFFVAFYYGIYPGLTYFILIASIPLCLISLAWVPLVLGTLSARFRDVPMIIQSILDALFWLTPVVFYLDQMGPKVALIFTYNPLTHYIALIREPLLGGVPTVVNWAIVLLVGLVGWTITLLFYSRFRQRIPYWL